MKKSLVLFHPIKNQKTDNVSQVAADLFDRLIKESGIPLQSEIPIKVHPGEPGNISYIRPSAYEGVIDILTKQNIKTYFIETNTVTGQRTNEVSHLKVAHDHGFTQIPFVVADGNEGKDHVLTPIGNKKHFKTCMIASKLANQKQIVVMTHFKGHGMAGFGGAIKMLGIGFASRDGKMDQHLKDYTPETKTIDWSNRSLLHDGTEFRERSAEYALAAVQNKQCIYLTFALNIVANCDCDGEPMESVYGDLGILASLDPVAIDKACMDLLTKREGKIPFAGSEILAYSQYIGLGSQDYLLKEV